MHSDVSVQSRSEAEQLRHTAAGAMLAARLAPFWGVALPLVMYLNIVPEMGTVTIEELLSVIAINLGWTAAALPFAQILRARKDTDTLTRGFSICVSLFYLTSPLFWGASIAVMWERGNVINHLFMTMTVFATALVYVGYFASHWRTFVITEVALTCVHLSLCLSEAMPMDVVLALISVPYCVTTIYCGGLVHSHLANALQYQFRAEKMSVRLIVSRDEARAASKAKSMFLANMSHELRTPLNAIIGFSDILKQQMFGPVGSDKYVEYAGDIWSSGTHLLKLVNDILDLSKIEAGRMELDRQRVVTRDALQDVARIIHVRAQLKEQQLTFGIETGCPDVYADPRALTQILVNLASNAVKFTMKGGIIKISARREGDFVEFIVSDNGIGISAADQKHLFKPFEQVENRYNCSEGGTGLGLALVHGLIKLHGGDVSFESELGSGTTVRVLIPIAQQVIIQNKAA
jgi:two-component system, cell cycle sensor histidine kinase PleC